MLKNIDDFDIVQKLKNTFPKLRNNHELLTKIIQIIAQEFQKNFYIDDEQKNNTLINNLYLIERYNLLSDFSSSIQQTISSINECMLVFIGDKNDYINYNHYLNAKKQNFNTPSGSFWHSWTPRNFSIISKTYLQFFIDNYSDILIQETQINLQTIKIQKQLQTNTFLEEQIKVKQKEILENKNLTEQQKKELNNKIDNLKKQFEKQELEISNLNIDIESFKTELNNKEVELKKITNISLSEKNELQNQIQLQKTLISNNQTSFNDLQSKYTNIQTELKNKDNQLQEQRIKLQEQETQINFQTTKIQKQLQTNTFLEEQIKEKQKEILENKNLTEQQKKELNNKIDNLKKQFEKQELEISNLNIDIESFKTKLNNKEAELKKITNISLSEKNELQNQIQLQKTLISNNQTSFNDLQSKYTNIQTELKNKDNQLQEQRIKLQEQETQINFQTTKIQKQLQTNIFLEEQIKEKQKEILENKNLTEQQKKELNNEIDNLKKQFEKQELEISNLNIDIESFKTKLNNKEAELKKITNISLSEKNELQNQIQLQKTLISNNQTFFNDLQSKYTNIQTELKNKDNQLQEQRIKLQEQETQINFQTTKIQKQLQTNTFLEEQIKEKQKEILENKNLTEQQKKELNNEIDNLKKQFEKQELEISNLNIDIESFKTKLNNKEAELKKITNISLSEKNELQNQIQLQKTLISNNQTSFNDLQSKYTNIQTELKNKDNQLQEQRIKLQEQETQINFQTTKIQKQLQTNTFLEEQIKEKQKEILENKNLTEQQKKELNNEIDNLKKQFEKQELEISNLNIDIESFKTKLNNKEAELKKITNISLSEKNELQNQIQLQKTLISNNQTSFNDLQSKYTNIQTELKNKDNQLQEQNQNMKDFAKQTILTINASHQILNNSIENSNKHINKLTNKLKKEEKNKIINKLENPKKFKVDASKLPTLREVIGFQEEISQLKEFLHYLKNPDKYKKIGVKKPPKGVLLYGPPGTGKTFLAQVISKEANLPFFALNSSDFSKTYLGEGPKLINEIFEEARKESPSIIFIDECESVFRSRVNNKNSHSDHDNMIAAFLTQTEGFKTDSKHPVFLIGATNYKDEIDPAILSRFSRHIKIDLLNVSDRTKFLKTLASSYQIDIRAYQYLDKIIEITEKYDDETLKTQRKLTDILDQAAIKAISHDHLNILPIDLQLSLSTQMNQKFNWGPHEHTKYLLTDLENLKEYKNIPIQHIYRDTNTLYNSKEKQYFDLIFGNSHSLKQKVYNSNDQKIQIINFSKNPDKIQKFYGTLNFLPPELLGFYFEDENPTQETTKMYESTTLEEFLDIRKKNTKKIYFIWNINKIAENMAFAQNLITNMNQKYPFLQKQEFLEKIYFSAKQKDITSNQIQQIIDEHIQQLKNNLNNKINTENPFPNSWFLTETLKTIITQEIDKNFQKPYHSISEIENSILENIHQKILENKKNIIQNKIKELVNNFKINHPWFENNQISHLKKLLYNKNNELYLLPLSLKDMDIEIIYNNFENIKNYQLLKIINNKWKQNLNYFNFRYPHFTQKEIKNIITDKVKSELFQPRVSLEQINQEIQKTIDENEIRIINNFQNEMSENIDQLLIEKKLYKNIPLNKINTIHKELLVLVKQELKKTDSNENKIQQKIKNFLENYQITPFSNPLLSFFQDKITLIAIISIVTILIFFIISKIKK
ncbi:AAA family ATPase [Candidatus Phytoplasma solani]|uniref:AAA family ATPase n=1 Tax=Candidatus Phytoplasma solani TaxID=69896 RepID=UPI0032DA194C